MYKEVEPVTALDVVLLNMSSDMWNKPYNLGEVTWGVILLIGIFAINLSVLWVVSRSRELWKPRHLWMACLCVTDLFVGGHKALELLLLLVPQRELCVIQRATLGIPYVVNMLLLTLLSLDRFVAVRYPFFYSSSVSNKHVAIGFLIVLLAGTSLAAASVTLGLQDPICRSQSLQLVYLTIVLAICSILTLFFNSSVLRIAKKQLNAIYAQEPSMRGRKRVSVVCTNCGYKNETYVNTLLPMSTSSGTKGMAALMTEMDSSGCGINSSTQPNILPLTDAMVLGPLNLDLDLNLEEIGRNMNISCDPSDQNPHCMDDTTAPLVSTQQLVRTVSLPTISETLTVPISLVVQPDPLIPPAVVIGNMSTEVDLGCKMTSMSHLDETCHERSIIGGHNTQCHTIPRSRSLVTCQTHKIIPTTASAPRLQLFRNLHFARAHMFHVGRLFPSIRFARTVLLIMIPMWVFILPIVTIIPLHRGCEAGNKSELNCDLVETLWRYLVVHMRSILPLQAILDTLIYSFGSKEFRQALKKIVKKHWQTK